MGILRGGACGSGVGYGGIKGDGEKNKMKKKAYCALTIRKALILSILLVGKRGLREKLNNVPVVTHFKRWPGIRTQAAWCQAHNHCTLSAFPGAAHGTGVTAQGCGAVLSSQEEGVQVREMLRNTPEKC